MGNVRAIALGVLVMTAAGGIVTLYLRSCSEAPETHLRASEPRIVEMNAPGADQPEAPPRQEIYPEKTEHNPDQLWLFDGMNVNRLYDLAEVPSTGRRPHYALLNTGRDRKISDVAIENLDLSEQEVGDLQIIIDNLFSEMEVLSAAHTEEDPLRTDLEKGVLAFRQLLPKEESTRALGRL